jgi:hypothetical protein
MNANQKHRRARRVGLTLGVAAVGALAALGLGHGGSAPTHTMVAGSGDAPTNTTYSQPAVGGMNVGSTSKWTPPDTEPAIASAVPAVKAGG